MLSSNHEIVKYLNDIVKNYEVRGDLKGGEILNRELRCIAIILSCHCNVIQHDSKYLETTCYCMI